MAVLFGLAAFLRAVLLAQSTAREQGEDWADQGEGWKGLLTEERATWKAVVADRDIEIGRLRSERDAARVELETLRAAHSQCPPRATP